MSRTFNSAMVGFGPANLGLLIAAYRRGEIQSYAQGGMVILDQSNRLGSGRFRDYRITANSLSSVFLEVLDDPRLNGLFNSLNDDVYVRRLRQNPDAAPQLALVGAVLEKMADRILSVVTKCHDVTVLRNTSVQSCALAGAQKRIEYCSGGKSRGLQADSVFLNCGGCQVAPDSGRFWTSEDLLSAPDAAIRAAMGGTSGRRIAIVGGSHSALSSVIRLSECLEGKDSNITVFSREEARIFYDSEADAREADYNFDPVLDICPLSGRVNRYSGLRYDSRSAALNIKKNGAICDNAPRVAFVYDDHPFEQMVQAGRFDLCVQATGYGAAGLLNDASFGKGDGRIYAVDGRRIAKAFSFGLGTGLRPTPEIGGEPSFRGRLDGFWLYANDIGDAVLNACQQDNEQQEEARYAAQY